MVAALGWLMGLPLGYLFAPLRRAVRFKPGEALRHA